jgi:ketosteroid isomerase-like protein
MSNQTNAGPITVPDPIAAVQEWFARLSQYCAAVDYDSARAIFAEDVVSFGTRARIVSGLDLLQANQWEGIWPNIQGFQIEPDTIHAGGDETYAWGIATWTSTGFDEAGGPFHRPGRATVILNRRAGRWLAVHTHFSLAPGVPPRTYGPLKQPGA